MPKMKMGKYTAGDLKIAAAILLISAIIYFAGEIPMTTSIDFSSVMKSVSSGKSDADQDNAIASLSENIEEIKVRTSYINESRARDYVESATLDYYHGSFEEALRRLDRAKIYDPMNFSIFKLSGQIYFEQSQYRKAFNNWERALQLPNDDQTITRDVDVIKRLIRHSRTEVDRLQRHLYNKPDDKMVIARLKELREQLRD